MKRLTWLKIMMMAVTAVVFAAFWLVGYDMPYDENADFNAPLLTDLLLWFIYVMAAAAVGVTVYSAVHGIRTHGRRQGMENGVPTTRITFLTWGTTLILLAVTFALGSTDPIKVNGTEYTDGLWLRMSDMFIYTSGVMIIIAIAVVAAFRRIR